MSTVRDEADLDLAAIATDARQSAGAVLEGRIRDRERGYMEVPFAVAVTTVANHLEEASKLEAERRGGRAPGAAAKKRILEHLAGALMRLEAFQATYDQKQPLGEAASVDLAHLLMAYGPPDGRPWDVPPPTVRTDAAGLGDLLLAMRAALGESAGAWQVSQPTSASGVTLRLGEATEEEADIPDLLPEVGRAGQVLGWLHPIELRAWIRRRAFGGDEVAGVELSLGDPAGTSPEAAVAALSGSDVELRPAALRAVRGLLEAPPLPEQGPPPPGRLVAILGVLKALDQDLAQRVVPQLETHTVRNAARELPRESTRKAPLRKRLLEGLVAEAPGIPFDRAPDLVDALVARGKIKRPGATEISVLLALFGRAWSHAGAQGQVAVARGALSDDDVLALAEDLADIGRIRQQLEGGRQVSGEEITRLECATITALGRLAQV